MAYRNKNTNLKGHIYEDIYCMLVPGSHKPEIKLVVSTGNLRAQNGLELFYIYVGRVSMGFYLAKNWKWKNVYNMMYFFKCENKLIVHLYAYVRPICVGAYEYSLLKQHSMEEWGCA